MTNQEIFEMADALKVAKDHRKWNKISSTYIDGYLKFINTATGRIHPNFYALSTDTGRFSCQGPNLQNAPRKTNDPIGVRNFIKAPDGHLIVSCDYSQIELRVGAHYCQDEIMLETYRTGGDIHAATTSVIFNIPYEQAVDDIDELVDLKRDIMRLIKKLADPEYQVILEERYLCFKKFEQIALDMGYSIQHIFRLHEKALKELAVIYKVES